MAAVENEVILIFVCSVLQDLSVSFEVFKKMHPTKVKVSRRGFRGGARGPGPPLSDHTTIIKFSGPLLKYFLHTFSIV